MPRIAVAFLHVGPDLALPTIMATSVRRAMPDAEIVQMTDAATPAVPGADTLQRLAWDGKKLMIYRLAHLAALVRPAALLLDTDIVVRESVADVFAQPFDVALTVRREPILDPNGVDASKLMPYNTGVMFSRSNDFWQAALTACRAMPEQLHDWWGDQFAVKAAVDSLQFDVLELECDRYNYTPADEHEAVATRAILHYKGPRKDWMKRQFG